MKTMSANDVSIGILSPSEADREVLRHQVEGLGVATVSIEVDQYCKTPGDRQTARFVDSKPDIVIVDLEEQQAAMESLKLLHAAIPESWLFVTSARRESELIIEAMRAGAREYLFKPIPPRSLAQALDRFIAERKRALQSKVKGKVYCVTSAKGGSGATTVSINLATSLAQVAEGNVALLDLNTPVGDAAAYLNLTPQYTVSDALAASSRLDAVLLESFMADAGGFDVLAGPKEFWPEPTPGVNGQAGTSALSRLLEVVSETYGHTVVDMTTYIDKQWLQLVLGVASRSVVVLTPELPALWRTKRLMSYLATCSDTKSTHLVLNRSRKSDEITEAEIERALKHPVYCKLPNNYNASIEAINTGNPIVSKNHSSLAASYEELALRLTGQEARPKSKKLFGLFNRNGRSE
ncbi:MAG TPA: AAA family ATPase [Vicinamibacteria bacterium]|nr:AAA family ATPase [Vicinamibacteria bacterium]